MPSMTGVLAAASAVPGPQQPFVVAGSFLSGLLPRNKKDPERIATAQRNLTLALAGDANALAALQAQAAGSATEVGKEAARRALAAYSAQKANFATPIPTPSPFQQVVQSTVAAVGDDLAHGVQQIGAGATTVATNKLGSGGALTVPITQNQMLLLAAVAVAIILLRNRG